MSQQKTPVELTNFSKGLITEANPLSFPPDASIDELNFNANRDGSRSRRLGMDYEADYSLISTGETTADISTLDVGVYRWENAGNNSDLTIAVVWVGNELHFHDLDGQVLSDTELFNSVTLSSFDKFSRLSFASIDGNLVVAAGAEEVAILSIGFGQVLTNYKRLLVRDLFGVADLYFGETGLETLDLRDSNNIQFRPKFKTDTHIYNLRNQSWGNIRRPYLETKQSFDPIQNFNSAAYAANDKYTDIKVVGVNNNLLPSNSDVVHYAMMADGNDEPAADNFFPRMLIQDPIGNIEAPRGYFIIDALRRGTSRLSAYKDLMARNPPAGTVEGLRVDIDTLPSDITPTGASQIEEFAGRVWYAGFSGQVIDGDDYSPRLNSYVLFSRLVSNTTDINKCYQEGDPTSEDTPDIIDSDGGYVRVSGAYGIKKLFNIGGGLAVLAKNGVWVILGATEDAGFTATGYQVAKITDYPILSAKSAVPVDSGLLYWSDDGIYLLAKNDIGAYSVKNLTQPTIQTFYESISSEEKDKCVGTFDPYERKVRWLYGDNKELIFDTNSGAFTKNEISTLGGLLKAPVRTTSFSSGTRTEDVIVDGVQVVVGALEVQSTESIRQGGFRSIKYLTTVDVSGDSSYTFSLYDNQSFKDWELYNGTGEDAEAYLVTGYMSGGDSQRNKQVPYITTHLLQTETGLDVDFNLVNQSSCLLTSQWDWTNNANSNRWGREFQTYKLSRHYIPEDSSFDNGHTVVSTKHKLRGKGKVVSLRFRTEPEKDCRILGWSMIVGTNVNV